MEDRGSKMECESRPDPEGCMTLVCESAESNVSKREEQVAYLEDYAARIESGATTGDAVAVEEQFQSMLVELYRWHAANPQCFDAETVRQAHRALGY